MDPTQQYRLPLQIEEFADRYFAELDSAIRNRMRRIGVPSDMIGIRFWGVDEGAFVRYFPPQLGGNIRIGLDGKPGINVDAATLDDRASKVCKLPSWLTASWKDRVDAVIAHEYTEVLAPAECDYHEYAIENAQYTTLAITERARQILSEYREAEGF